MAWEAIDEIAIVLSTNLIQMNKDEKYLTWFPNRCENEKNTSSLDFWSTKQRTTTGKILVTGSQF